MASELLKLFIHKVGIELVVNEITLHTENKLNFTSCRFICLGQSLNNTVVGYGNRLMPPLYCALYKGSRRRDAVHFGKICMKVKLNPFLRCVIGFLYFGNG